MKLALICAVTLTVLLATGAVSASETTKADCAKDVVLVADRSGSLWFDKKNGANSRLVRKALLEVIKDLAKENAQATEEKDKHRVAVVAFSGSAEIVLPFGIVGTAGYKVNQLFEAAKKWIPNKTSGTTNHFEAYQKALELFSKNPSPRRRMSVMVTDGVSNCQGTKNCRLPPHVDFRTLIAELKSHKVLLAGTLLNTKQKPPRSFKSMFSVDSRGKHVLHRAKNFDATPLLKKILETGCDEDVDKSSSGSSSSSSSGSSSGSTSSGSSGGFSFGDSSGSDGGNSGGNSPSSSGSDGTPSDSGSSSGGDKGGSSPSGSDGDSTPSDDDGSSGSSSSGSLSIPTEEEVEDPPCNDVKIAFVIDMSNSMHLKKSNKHLVMTKNVIKNIAHGAHKLMKDGYAPEKLKFHLTVYGLNAETLVKEMKYQEFVAYLDRLKCLRPQECMVKDWGWQQREAEKRWVNWHVELTDGPDASGKPRNITLHASTLPGNGFKKLLASGFFEHRPQAGGSANAMNPAQRPAHDDPSTVRIAVHTTDGYPFMTQVPQFGQLGVRCHGLDKKRHEACAAAKKANNYESEALTNAIEAASKCCATDPQGRCTVLPYAKQLADRGVQFVSAVYGKCSASRAMLPDDFVGKRYPNLASMQDLVFSVLNNQIRCGRKSKLVDAAPPAAPVQQ